MYDQKCSVWVDEDGKQSLFAWRVEIHYIPASLSHSGKAYYRVQRRFEGVDRPTTFMCSAGGSAKLAERLANAMRANAVFKVKYQARDVDGNTYIHEAHDINTHRMSAELTRLGF